MSQVQFDEDEANQYSPVLVGQTSVAVNLKVEESIDGDRIEKKHIIMWITVASAIIPQNIVALKNANKIYFQIVSHAAVFCSPCII